MIYIAQKDIKIPQRKKDSKKGDNGKVLIVGGSEDYIGCLALAGLSALRTGVDWVTIAAPEKVSWAINCLTPDLITKKCKGSYFHQQHIKEIVELSNKFDVVLIGNGAGIKKQTQLFFKKIIKNITKYKVIDADGIKAININDINNAILAPHLRELKLLLKNSQVSKKIITNIVKEKNIRKRACLILKTFKNRLQNNILIVKGPVDIIMYRNKAVYNRTGNPGMTQGGTGDVLAGLAAGFLAQSKDLFQAAINATYINGVIGDMLLKKKKGYSYIASDMVDEIKNVVSRIKT